MEREREKSNQSTIQPTSQSSSMLEILVLMPSTPLLERKRKKINQVLTLGKIQEMERKGREGLWCSESGRWIGLALA
jgi:hypothetical protein